MPVGLPAGTAGSAGPSPAPPTHPKPTEGAFMSITTTVVQQSGGDEETTTRIPLDEV
ncbi:hypothetical protein [Streptomyces sp. NPDC059970]|uniref:hypothetical protein n=1 Tax=Streptomyces sp. NPDC059970 TaxID=3347019 RepID=UPI0036CFBCD4